MQLPSTNDKRTDFRVRLDLLLNKYVAGQPHLARATNISRRGLGLERVSEPRANSASVGLQFQLPSSTRVITCAARIVHQDCDHTTQGAVFTDIDPEHQRLIDDYILSQLDWP